MANVSDAVKAQRAEKAKAWIMVHNKTCDLYYASASGYYVPLKYRSSPATKIDDETVIELMKAQGYKPRDTNKATEVSAIVDVLATSADEPNELPKPPALKKQRTLDEMALLKDMHDMMGTMLELMKQTREIKSNGERA
jgi:hypothetical protein